MCDTLLLLYVDLFNFFKIKIKIKILRDSSRVGLKVKIALIKEINLYSRIQLKSMAHTYTHSSKVCMNIEKYI